MNCPLHGWLYFPRWLQWGRPWQLRFLWPEVDTPPTERYSVCPLLSNMRGHICSPPSPTRFIGSTSAETWCVLFTLPSIFNTAWHVFVEWIKGAGWAAETQLISSAAELLVINDLSWISLQLGVQVKNAGQWNLKWGFLGVNAEFTKKEKCVSGVFAPDVPTGAWWSQRSLQGAFLRFSKYEDANFHWRLPCVLS